jgi:hypothetical protein
MLRTHHISDAAPGVSVTRLPAAISHAGVALVCILLASALAPALGQSNQPTEKATIQEQPLDGSHGAASFNPGMFGEAFSRVASTSDSMTNADRLPRWIAEVRAQRQALAKHRREYHESRLRLNEEALQAQAELHQHQHQQVSDHLNAQRRALLGDRQPILPFIPPPPLDAHHPSAIPHAPMASWLGGPWATPAQNAKRPVRMPPAGIPSVPMQPAQMKPTQIEQAQHTQTASESPVTGDKEPASQAAYPATDTFSPTQWDNRWYYRGW